MANTKRQTPDEPMKVAGGKSYNTIEIESARICVSPRTLWSLCRAGFPHIRVGTQYRFDPKKTDEYLASQKSMCGAEK